MSEGLVFAFSPVPIRGLGTAGGMEMFLQSRANADAKKLAETVQQFLGDLRKRPDLTATNSFFRASVPQLFVEVDREKALSLGVPISDIFDALQSTMGALYVNDFNKFGRTYRVQMQAEPQFRVRPEDLGNVYVRLKPIEQRARDPFAVMAEAFVTMGRASARSVSARAVSEFALESTPPS